MSAGIFVGRLISVGIPTCVTTAGAVPMGARSVVPELKSRIGTLHRQQSTSRPAPAIVIFPVKPEFQKFLRLFSGLCSRLNCKTKFHPT